MKALSIRQPWAWLIVNGHKNIENRTWTTKHRGKIYIHASQTFDKEGYEWAKKKFRTITMPAPGEFEKGGIVGEAVLTDCVTYSRSP